MRIEFILIRALGSIGMLGQPLLILRLHALRRSVVFRYVRCQKARYVSGNNGHFLFFGKIYQRSIIRTIIRPGTACSEKIFFAQSICQKVI